MFFLREIEHETRLTLGFKALLCTSSDRMLSASCKPENYGSSKSLLPHVEVFPTIFLY
jgi:hypothetical protein